MPGHRMRLFATAMILASALCTQAAEFGLELIQPQAGLILGVEWRRIMESPLGDTVVAQIRKISLAWNPAVEAGLRSNFESILIAVPATAHANDTTQLPITTQHSFLY
jgi:hypothetical protein